MAKTFISFIGTGNYDNAGYYFGDNDNIYETAYVQAAMLRLVCADKPGDKNPHNKWGTGDRFLVFETPEARDKHHKHLEEALKAANDRGIAIEFAPINVRQKQSDLTHLFQDMYDRVNLKDRLYIDMTHSFRAIPVYYLALAYYAHALKDAALEGIYYGNFVRGVYETPIWDLTSSLRLLNWSLAANDFKRLGAAERLTGMIENGDLRVAVRKFSQDFQAARLFSVFDGENARNLLGQLERLDAEDAEIRAPLRNILEGLKTEVKRFDRQNDARNGIAAARWCLEHQLYQQCATILRETLAALLLAETEPEFAAPKHSKEWIERQSLYVDLLSVWRKSKEEWRGALAERKDEPWVEKALNSPLFDKIKTPYDNIKGLRNDLNHAGIQKQFDSHETIIKNLRKNLEKIEQALQANKPVGESGD